MILAILAVVTATFQPATPTVGDPIAIEFATPVVLDASKDYEIVAREGKRVVVRTFAPRPFSMSGTAGAVRFRNLVVPVRSVLKPNDDLKPAPLVPPQGVTYPRKPFLAIGISALCALAAWAAVWRFFRKPVGVPVVSELPAEERFRRAVAVAKTHPERWAALADATRAYLAATRPRLGPDLTTAELLPRLQEEQGIVSGILRQGDLEKFSVEGAEPDDFDRVAQRALELAS